jgi:hypothetical protein
VRFTGRYTGWRDAGIRIASVAIVLSKRMPKVYCGGRR